MVLDHHRVDAGRGLVEQHELGVAHQDRGELQQLLLSVGELAGGLSARSASPNSSRTSFARSRSAAVTSRRRTTATGLLDRDGHVLESVRCAKTRGCWKVRVSPRRHRVGSGRRRRGRRRRRAGVGTQVPRDMLKTVVLPDPFGPIRAVMVPSGTTKEQSATAVRRRTAWSGRRPRGARSRYGPSQPAPRRWRRPSPAVRPRASTGSRPAATGGCRAEGAG